MEVWRRYLSTVHFFAEKICVWRIENSSVLLSEDNCHSRKLGHPCNSIKWGGQQLEHGCEIWDSLGYLYELTRISHRPECRAELLSLLVQTRAMFAFYSSWMELIVQNVSKTFKVAHRWRLNSLFKAYTVLNEVSAPTAINTNLPIILLNRYEDSVHW